MEQHYETKTFNLPDTIPGLSEKQLEIHLKLYAGYVKHVNLIRDQIKSLKESATEQYVIDEVRRRFAFEFDGMRMHEYYFAQLEGGPQELDGESAFAQAASEKYGSIDGFTDHLKEVAGTRGIGWVVVTYDPAGEQLHTSWVSDHEFGQLSGLPIMLAIDMWEHAYMVDYVPGEKGDYFSSYLTNVNWSIVQERFEKTS